MRWIVNIILYIIQCLVFFFILFSSLFCLCIMFNMQCVLSFSHRCSIDSLLLYKPIAQHIRNNPQNVINVCIFSTFTTAPRGFYSLFFCLDSFSPLLRRSTCVFFYFFFFLFAHKNIHTYTRNTIEKKKQNHQSCNKKR